MTMFTPAAVRHHQLTTVLLWLAAAAHQTCAILSLYRGHYSAAAWQFSMVPVVVGTAWMFDALTALLLARIHKAYFETEIAESQLADAQARKAPQPPGASNDAVMHALHQIEDR